MTSIFTKSPQPSSRESLAMRTASSAFLAPEVFGRSFSDVIEDICKASFVCTAKCKGDDLCFCFFDAGFNEIE